MSGAFRWGPRNGLMEEYLLKQGPWVFRGRPELQELKATLIGLNLGEAFGEENFGLPITLKGNWFPNNLGFGLFNFFKLLLISTPKKGRNLRGRVCWEELPKKIGLGRPKLFG